MSVGRKTKLSILIVIVLFSMALATKNPCVVAASMKEHTATSSSFPIAVTSSAIPSADPNWPFDIWITAGSYYSFYAYRTEDTALYGSFDVLTSSGINFFICDQSNFELWTSGYTALIYERIPSTGGTDWTFIIPYSDTWYLMFDNTGNLFYQSHVTGTNRLDNTAPTTVLNLEDGSTYSGTVTITASASDEGFGVYSLILYIDGALKQTEYDNSLTYNWDTRSVQDGQCTIRIRAEDGAGHITEIEVDVNVSNLPGILVPLIAAGIGIPVLVGLTIVVFRKMRSPTTRHMRGPIEGPGIGSEFIDQGYVERPPVKQFTAFCPSCGTARTSPSARFCGNCGASFPD